MRFTLSFTQALAQLLARSLDTLPLNYLARPDDGSGELDSEEFVAALGAAGFDEDEAQEIYEKVNTDGDGGVSIEEFEQW